MFKPFFTQGADLIFSKRHIRSIALFQNGDIRLCQHYLASYWLLVPIFLSLVFSHSMSAQQISATLNIQSHQVTIEATGFQSVLPTDYVQWEFSQDGLSYMNIASGPASNYATGSYQFAYTHFLQGPMNISAGNLIYRFTVNSNVYLSNTVVYQPVPSGSLQVTSNGGSVSLSLYPSAGVFANSSMKWQYSENSGQSWFTFSSGIADMDYKRSNNSFGLSYNLPPSVQGSIEFRCIVDNNLANPIGIMSFIQSSALTPTTITIQRAQFAIGDQAYGGRVFYKLQSGDPNFNSDKDGLFIASNTSFSNIQWGNHDNTILATSLST